MSIPVVNAAVRGSRVGRRRVLALVAVFALAVTSLALVANPVSATDHDDGTTTPRKRVPVQLLAFNDYHGHLEADGNGEADGVVAGGGEYLSSKLSELREGVPRSLTVAAGDLIGGSPAFSGLFHDEPSVESLNAMELDVSSVGNHEFDEGVTELLRMQDGGCHPVDGCYFRERGLRRRRFPVACCQYGQRRDRQDAASAVLDQEVPRRARWHSSV